METPKIRSHLDQTDDGLGLITNKAKKVLALSGYNLVKPSEEIKGVNKFPGYENVFWTDADIDASSSEGRRDIALNIGVELQDIVSFSAVNHTNEVLIVDSPEGIKQLTAVKNPNNGDAVRAGWSEPVSQAEFSEEESSYGADRSTYDGIILVGREKFEGKYLLATGADCTPIGVRGMLESGEEFIAIAHAGRKGTMTGVVENLAKRMRWLGVRPATLEVFVGPAAQAIEVPSSVLEKESSGENTWRVASISQEYSTGDETRVLYNNQFDSIRRLIENLNIQPEQVHVVDADTVGEESRGRLHSFRRDKTTARNSLVIGFP